MCVCGGVAQEVVRDYVVIAARDGDDYNAGVQVPPNADHGYH